MFDVCRSGVGRVCVCVCVGSVGPSWVVLLSAVLCIIILMLPLSTGNDTSSASLTHYCIVTVHQKLIAAYILGLFQSLAAYQYKQTE